MLQPECDVCGQPATIHETVISGGGRLPVTSARNMGVSSLPTVVTGVQATSHPTAEELYRSLSEAERGHMALVYRLTKRGI
jgi:hypothetical protein